MKQDTSPKGLTDGEVLVLRQKFGRNVFRVQGKRKFIHIASDILREPMFILLEVSCAIYFLLGQNNEGYMMLMAMLFVAAISLFQDAKSSIALNSLRELTEPLVMVVRNGKTITIPTEELVPEDVIRLEEGSKVPADAMIIHENDLTINESIISGEAFPVEKNRFQNNKLFQGTLVNSGKCIAKITATGNNTVLGKLGQQVSAYSSPKTILQQEIRKFTRRLAFFGIAAFALIWLLNYLETGLFSQSFLAGLTLAMAVIPEEIPVAFTSFMALGAYHMAKLGIISREPQTIENLGALTVFCVDKTGTITENKMNLKFIYDHNTGETFNLEDGDIKSDSSVLWYSMLASEVDPFDSMEVAIVDAYNKSGVKSPALRMIYEYKLSGKPPMMTHVYEKDGITLAAAKGAVEKILTICELTNAEKEDIRRIVKHFASAGYRVLGVARAQHSDEKMPLRQEEFKWKLEGVIALYDPPKKNIEDVFHKLSKAGIRIKLLTGDHPETAINIAKQVGLNCGNEIYNGEQIMSMKSEELSTIVRDAVIFARMFPEAKLKVIEALKANGETVVMTGDGVNDGPALKAANIGIAVGKKGSEIARSAADLVLTDDNLAKLVEAITQGRKIFSNLKKAIRYIISIHIPIILTASLPVIFAWKYPNIFTPVHVIFLELIMGPTCSVFFEREPAEKNLMSTPPRLKKTGLFTTKEMLLSIVQGLAITAGTLTVYFYMMNTGRPLGEIRTMVFTTLVLANIFLTFTNRSFTHTLDQTIRYKNNLAPWIILLSSMLLLIIHLVPVARNLFSFLPVTPGMVIISAAVALVSVMWFEVYKMVRANGHHDQS